MSRIREGSSKWRSLHRLTTERAAIVIVFMLLFAMASRVAIEPDMWWHLRVGQQILETGDPVYADSFTHTQPGRIHKNHSWLSQVVMAWLWRAFGHLGLTVFVASIAVVAMAFIYRTGRGSIYAQSFALVLSGACAAAVWSPRPQMFTFLCAAILLFLLRRHKDNRLRRCWLLSLLMWLWANLHAGYIVGFVIVLAYLLGEALNQVFGAGEPVVAWRRLWRLGAVALFSLALLPINPLGLDVYAVPFETFGISGLRDFVQEWMSPDFAHPATWPFVGLALALLAACWASRRGFDFGDFFLAGGTFFMALSSARHISFFALVATPIIARHLHALAVRNGWSIRRGGEASTVGLALNLALVGLVAFGTLARVAYVSSSDAVDRALALNYPVASAAHLQDSAIEGNLFNSYNWGGYLILYAPDLPVFIDGRTDLHRHALAEYAAAAFGTRAWEDVFARRDIGVALIERDSPLASRLDEDARWRLEFQDEASSVFVLIKANGEVDRQ